MTDKKKQGLLRFNGISYPTNEIQLNGQTFVSTQPLIQGKDTVVTIKPKLYPKSRYEIVEGTPDGRFVFDLSGKYKGTADNNLWELIMRAWGISTNQSTQNKE